MGTEVSSAKVAVWVEAGPPPTSFTAKTGAAETSGGQLSSCLWTLSRSVLGEEAAPPEPGETPAPCSQTSLLAKSLFLVPAWPWGVTRRSPGTVPLPHGTYLASSARAITPAASGAEAEVPVCLSVQRWCRSVVTWGGEEGSQHCCQLLEQRAGLAGVG